MIAGTWKVIRRETLLVELHNGPRFIANFHYRPKITSSYTLIKFMKPKLSQYQESQSNSDNFFTWIIKILYRSVRQKQMLDSFRCWGVTIINNCMKTNQTSTSRPYGVPSIVNFTVEMLLWGSRSLWIIWDNWRSLIYSWKAISYIPGGRLLRRMGPYG